MRNGKRNTLKAVLLGNGIRAKEGQVRKILANKKSLEIRKEQYSRAKKFKVDNSFDYMLHSMLHPVNKLDENLPDIGLEVYSDIPVQLYE